MSNGDKGTVLLAWELGEGFGHARRLLDVGNALAAHGWRPVFVSRTIQTMSREYRDAGFPVLQCPAHTSLTLTDQPFSANSYSDIMAICGFADREAMYPSLAAWDELLRLVNPRLIIADYSPLLSLAAFDRYPLISFGDGFVAPPAQDGGFPPTGSSRPPVIAYDRLMEEVHQVQSLRGAPKPDSLSQFICGQGQVVCAYPVLDVYGRYRPEPATGPVSRPAESLPAATERRIFVYLSATYRLTRAMLQGVINSRVPAEGYIRDLDKDTRLAGDLRQCGFVLHDRPPPLSEAMKKCSVIVHHGGAGTLETAALLGRVQLLVPRHLEQTMNAGSAGALGSAMRMRANFEVKDGVGAVHTVIDNEKMHQSAARAAAHLSAFPCGSLEKLLTLSDRFAA